MINRTQKRHYGERRILRPGTDTSRPDTTLRIDPIEDG